MQTLQWGHLPGPRYVAAVAGGSRRGAGVALAPLLHGPACILTTSTGLLGAVNAPGAVRSPRVGTVLWEAWADCLQPYVEAPRPMGRGAGRMLQSSSRCAQHACCGLAAPQAALQQGRAQPELAFVRTSTGHSQRPGRVPPKVAPGVLGPEQAAGSAAETLTGTCTALTARRALAGAWNAEPWARAAGRAGADGADQGGPPRCKVRGPSAPRASP